MNKKHFIVPFVFSILSVQILFAQVPIRYISIGPSLASYKGDLSGYSKYSSGFELSLIQNKDKRIRGLLNFSVGSVIAQTVDDVYTQLDYEPLKFVKTSFIGLNYTLNYFFIKKKHFKSYFGIGFGIFQFKPKDQSNVEAFSTANNTRIASETYALTKPMLPVQFGAIYTMKNDFGIQFNVKWLNTKTDYLDNMSRLANPDNNDNILLINLGLVVPMKAPKRALKTTELPTSLSK